jgi:hypothetical protein
VSGDRIGIYSRVGWSITIILQLVINVAFVREVSGIRPGFATPLDLNGTRGKIARWSEIQ